MDGQNPQRQNDVVNGANSARDSARSQKSGQVTDGVLITPRTISNVADLEKEKAKGASQRLEETGLNNTGRSSGSEQVGGDRIRASERMRCSLPNIQNIQRREDDHSARSQPFASNITPDISGNSMNNTANAMQIALGNSDANHGADGSGNPRQGGSGWMTPVAPPSRKVSHNQTVSGTVTPNASRNSTPRVRTLRQPGYRAGDPIICVYCMDSQGIGSSCPKCGKHNNEKARRYVPGERPDMCLPIDDEIAVGSVPGSPRLGAASRRSPTQADDTPGEFQYASGNGASGNERAAFARAQIAAQLRDRFGNDSAISGRNAATLTSGQNTESDIQRPTCTNAKGSNLKGSTPVESISVQQSQSSQEMTPRTEGSFNGMRPWENSSGGGDPVRGGPSDSGRSHSCSRTKPSATATAVRLLIAGGSSILGSKLSGRRIVLGTGTGSPDAGAPGKQQGMQPVAPSRPSGRHSTGESFSNAYANASGGGYPSAPGYSGSHESRRKDARVNNPVNLITSSSVGDEETDDENNKNDAARGSLNVQAMFYDKELEKRVISNLQNVDTQNMEGQNADPTGYPYERAVSNPLLYHPVGNQMDAQAGSVHRVQSGMQGIEGYSGMSENGIGSLTGSQSIRGGRKPEKHSKLGSVISGKMSAQGLFSTLKGSLRGDRKGTENANSMSVNFVNGQNQTETTSASPSAPRSPTVSPQQSFPANGDMQQMRMQNQMQQTQMQDNVHMVNEVQAGPSAMSTNVNSVSPSPSMHTPITHTSNNIPSAGMRTPTANNMYSKQAAQQQAHQQDVADAVAQQQLKIQAKRALEVEQAKAANMAVIRASRQSGSIPQKSRDAEFGNRDEMIATPRGQEKKSSQGPKSKKENARRSSQQKEQEQDAFREQEQEVGFPLSKQCGSNTQDRGPRTCSRSAREVPMEAVFDRPPYNMSTEKITDSADSGFAQGKREDGGWANVPAGANGNGAAVVNGNNMNFGDGTNFVGRMDSRLNSNGSMTVPIKRNGVPSQKRGSNKDANHTGVNESPCGNNTQSNKDCEDYCNNLVSSVDLNEVSGLVNSSEATNSNNKALKSADKALKSVDAVNSVRNTVPVSNVNVSNAHIHRVPSLGSSIHGDSLVEVNRKLDELEKARENELLVYSRDSSVVDGVGFLRREFSVNDPLAYMIDHDDSSCGYDQADTYTGCDEQASHYSGLESGGSGTSHRS